MNHASITLDGRSLTRAQLLAIAHGGAVALDAGQLRKVARAADFLVEQVRLQEPIYGVSTGFGSNADRLLGAHPLRDELPGATPSGRSLSEELQHNLIVSHAVCTGEPFAPEVVRAMLAIRINTLMRGHSGVRPSTLQALADMLNAGIVPVVPRLGSVGASGDLAPLSHLAIVLLGEGDEMVMAKPGFFVTELCALSAGAKVVAPEYPRADMAFPLAAVLAAVTQRTRLIVVVSPNNPTGTRSGQRTRRHHQSRVATRLVSIDLQSNRRWHDVALARDQSAFSAA